MLVVSAGCSGVRAAAALSTREPTRDASQDINCIVIRTDRRMGDKGAPQALHGCVTHTLCDSGLWVIFACCTHVVTRAKFGGVVHTPSSLRTLGCSGSRVMVDTSLLNSLISLALSADWGLSTLMATAWPRQVP